MNLFSVYKREKYNVPIETFYMFLLISANLNETLSTMDPWGEAPAGGGASGGAYPWCVGVLLEVLTPPVTRRAPRGGQHELLTSDYFLPHARVAAWECQAPRSLALLPPNAPSHGRLLRPTCDAKILLFYCLFVSLDDVTLSHADVAHVSCCSRLLLFQNPLFFFFLI